jgi:hypothetical protein
LSYLIGSVERLIGLSTASNGQLILRCVGTREKNQGFGLGIWGRIGQEKLTNAQCPMPDLHE